MIALATFGSDQSGSISGVHRLMTYDLPMINGFKKNRTYLERHLRAMTAQLATPFNQVALPQLMSPDQVLREWTGT